jgi:hypothetical protein
MCSFFTYTSLHSSGHVGVKRFFGELATALTPDTPTTFFPKEYHVAGNVCTVLGLEIGDVIQDGVAFSHKPFWNFFAHVFYFNDAGDKVVKFRANYNVMTPDSVPSPF